MVVLASIAQQLALTPGDMRLHMGHLLITQNQDMGLNLLETIGKCKQILKSFIYRIHSEFDSSPGRRWRHSMLTYQRVINGVELVRSLSLTIIRMLFICLEA